jgi:hypothetical protein
MRFFFSVNRNQSPILIILLIVILLGAAYLFIYIPSNEKELQKEHFRWLQRIDDNIQSKIENSDTLLSHLLDFYSVGSSYAATKKYISSFSKDNFDLFDTILSNTSSNSAKVMEN